MTDPNQGGTPDDQLKLLAKNSRLFAIQMSAGERGPSIAYAIAERIYFLTPEGAGGSNLGGFTYQLLERLFAEANPELIARAIPLQASQEPGHRGLVGEVNLNGQVNDVD